MVLSLQNTGYRTDACFIYIVYTLQSTYDYMMKAHVNILYMSCHVCRVELEYIYMHV